MKRRTLPILLFTTLLLAACGDAPSPTPAPTQPAQANPTTTAISAPAAASPTTDPGAANNRKPGHIAGSITRADGTPLPDAHISMYGTTLAGSNTYLETQSDNTGHYTQQAPDGIYEITAYTNVTYNDRTYGLWLDPADGITTRSQSSAEGVVKDFVWRTGGPKPIAKSKPKDPQSYYGGIISLGNNAQFEMQYNNGNLVETHAYPDGSSIRITLTPTDTLIDGSEAKTLTYDLDPNTLGTGVVQDVPLGDYTATAALVDANGASTDLQIATIIPTGKIGEPHIPANSAPVVFRPYSMGDYGIEALPMFVLPAP